MKPIQEYIELDQKYRIAVNALKAIETRIYKGDEYLNKTMFDCAKTAENALKMMGEKK